MKLLASYWNHTWDDMFMFLRSLDDLRKHYSGYSYGKSMSIEVVSDHYENLPMQYTENILVVKMKIFGRKSLTCFLFLLKT